MTVGFDEIIYRFGVVFSGAYLIPFSRKTLPYRLDQPVNIELPPLKTFATFFTDTFGSVPCPLFNYHSRQKNFVPPPNFLIHGDA